MGFAIKTEGNWTTTDYTILVLSMSPALVTYGMMPEWLQVYILFAITAIVMLIGFVMAVMATVYTGRMTCHKIDSLPEEKKRLIICTITIVALISVLILTG